MTKPFHKDELVARIHAIVRRSKGHAQSVINTGDLVVNLDTKTVEVNGARVHLTGKEYQMLELLSLRKGTTLTKEMFLNHLYGGMDEPELKIIDVFICKLRKKLANASSGKNYIETVWGRGYVLREPTEDEVKNSGVSSETPETRDKPRRKAGFLFWTATAARLSLRVVEDDAERVAVAGAHAAHAVAHVDAVDAARALHRAVVHREDHRLALPQRHDLGARLHARALLGQHELAAGEIARPAGQQDRHLQRKDVLAVEVLVQAVVVARAVLQQQRRRPRLPGLVAAREISPRARRDSAPSMPIASFQRLAIARERRIERGAQRGDEVGQRIGEVLVLAAAEAVPRHDDPAAERRRPTHRARRAPRIRRASAAGR